MNISKKSTSLNSYKEGYSYLTQGLRLCLSAKKTKGFSNIGVWLNGHCSWLNEHDWEIFPFYYVKNGLAVSLAYNRDSNLHLTILDQANADGLGYTRKLIVKNQSNLSLDVRVVFHQKSLTDSGDEQITFYSPLSKALIHSANGEYTLVSGSFGENSQRQFAAGPSQTTWDEPSGLLSIFPIADKSLESMFTIRLQLNPGDEQYGAMWMLQHSALKELQEQHTRILSELGL